MPNDSDRKAERERERRLLEVESSDLADDDLVWLLRRRNAPTDIPPCRVCGAALSMQACGGGKPTAYACSGTDENGRYLPGRSPADEHYVRSEFEDRRHANPDVLELVERFDRLRGAKS